MKRPLILAILGVLIIAGILAGIKALQIGRMIDQGKQFVPPPETVTTYRVQPQQWDARLGAVGSLSAVQGVTVSAETPGKIVAIAFQSGSRHQTAHRACPWACQRVSGHHGPRPVAGQHARLAPGRHRCRFASA